MAILSLGRTFESITAPSGYGRMTLTGEGGVIDDDFTAGEVFNFAPNVRQFRIDIVDPLSLPPGSVAASSFAMKLTFAGASAGGMTWASLVTAPVPETSTFALSLLGLVGLGVLAGTRRRKDD
jgi:hypothetical protein